ncbi:MAG: hypothetical protein LBF19_03515 [Prevotellaceae bacterium]|jgi:hypothetical protein|nr:hypothetical protein [Prevotellaceae bacterium]
MRNSFFLMTVGYMMVTVAALSQTDSTRYSGFHFGFVYPLSTNGWLASQYTNGASWHVLAGVSQNEQAFTLSGLANIIYNDATGLQLAGLFNYVGHNGTGIMLSGLVSNVENNYKGVLLSGLINRNRREVIGIQIAGLVNAADDLNGIQLAGIVNAADNLNGIQCAGLISAADDLNGIQYAGLMSAADDLSGVQLAGLVNRAERVKGVQLAGLLNIADSSDYSIAFINIIQNGEKGIALSYDETGSVVASFRSGGRVTYGILGIGYNHKAGKQSFLVDGGWGAHINCTARFRIKNELTIAALLFYKNPTFKVGYRLHAAYRLLPHIEIFAGPSIHYMQTNNGDHADMFPRHALWKNDGVSKLQQVFIGYQAGVQYLF